VAVRVEDLREAFAACAKWPGAEASGPDQARHVARAGTQLLADARVQTRAEMQIQEQAQRAQHQRHRPGEDQRQLESDRNAPRARGQSMHSR